MTQYQTRYAGGGFIRHRTLKEAVESAVLDDNTDGYVYSKKGKRLASISHDSGRIYLAGWEKV